MRGRWLVVLAGCLLALRGTEPRAQTVRLADDTSRLSARGVWVIETFEGTLDDARWRSGPTDVIVPDGGNADEFLATGPIVSEAPSIEALPGTVFGGAYRFVGVTELGVDVHVIDANPPQGSRPVCLELTNSNGSPEDPTDDCVVVQVGKTLSAAEGAWQSYTFKVPSYLTRIPNGWTVRGACGQPSDDAVWVRVMGSVSTARFVLGDPGLVYPTVDWQIGFDNPRIRIGGKGGSGPALADELVVVEE